MDKLLQLAGLPVGEGGVDHIMGLIGVGTKAGSVGSAAHQLAHDEITDGIFVVTDDEVTVEPGEGKVDFSLESSVINQYGNQLRKVALETLKNLDIDNVRITIVDKGALDCTLKARIEGAVFRSVDQYENLPWGGAIR